MNRRLPPIERFWRFVTVQHDGCWLWTGATTRSGYAWFNDGERSGRAHRFAFRAFVGPIPDGLQLDHLCRVRHCVNPAHLEPVTNRENVLRGVGPTSENASKTHCPQGHEYSPDNTLVNQRRGYRTCRECKRERDRAFRAARKAS